MSRVIKVLKVGLLAVGIGRLSILALGTARVEAAQNTPNQTLVSPRESQTVYIYHTRVMARLRGTLPNGTAVSIISYDSIANLPATSAEVASMFEDARSSVEQRAAWYPHRSLWTNDPVVVSYSQNTQSSEPQVAELPLAGNGAPPSALRSPLAVTRLNTDSSIYGHTLVTTAATYLIEGVISS